MRVRFLGLALAALAAGSCLAQPSEIAGLRTFGTAGKERQVLKPGVEAELFRHTGKGCLTHMWFGGDFPNYGRTRIRVYVDGERDASIDMELMMGHGIGFQDEGAPWGVERIGKTGQPSGIYDTYRIPFGKTVRVTATRTIGESGDPPFWWIIHGVDHLRAELGGVQLPESARLRLHKVENRAAKPLEEIDLYNRRGAGALYQVTIAAKSSNFSFLESCVRAYLECSQEPTYLSSGMEDYFLGTYYFNRGRYYTPVAGVTHIVREKEFSAYRFHEADPIFFQLGLRLTVRAGEKIGGKLFNPETPPAETVFTTYAWAYEW